MEILPVLRLIWRRRIVLAAATVAAVAVLVALGGTHPRSSSGAVAWTAVVLDTPKSQLVDVAPPGADTLPWRASLLTHLMATEASTQALARRLGVPAYQVAVFDPELSLPLVPTWTARGGATAASLIYAPYVLTVFVKDGSLPMISIEASALDRGRAKRLADAAVGVLESESSPAGHFTSLITTGGKGASLQPFVVEPVAPVRVKVFRATALPVTAIGASLFVFLVVCTGGLLLPKLSRRIHARDRALPA